MKILKFVKRTVTTDHEIAILKQEIIKELKAEVETIKSVAQLLEGSQKRNMPPLKFALERENERGFSPLQVAVDLGNSVVARIFLELGADIDSMGRDSYQRTPLHLAAYRNDTASIILLLTQGADVHARNLQHETPLLVAVKHGCNSDEAALATLRCFMAKQADVNAVDASGCLFIQYAAERGFFKTVQYLLEQQAQRLAIPHEKAVSPLRPMLYTPIEKGDSKMVEFLLSRGVNIAAIDFQNKCTIFATACRLKNANIVRVMLPYVNNPILIEDAFLEMKRCGVDSAEIREMLEQKKALLPKLLQTDKEREASREQLITLERPIIGYTSLLEPIASKKLTPPSSNQKTSESDSTTHIALFSGVLNNANPTPRTAPVSRNAALIPPKGSAAPAALFPPPLNWNPPTPNWNPPGSNLSSTSTPTAPSSWQALQHIRNSNPTPTPPPCWDPPQAPRPSSLFPVPEYGNANHNSALVPPTSLLASQSSPLTPPVRLNDGQSSMQTSECNSDFVRKKPRGL